MEKNFFVFLIVFGISAAGGVAAILRSGVKLSILNILSGVMNSGLLGLGISLLWYNDYQDNIYFLVGVCVLCGLGGMTTVDLVLKLFRQGYLPKDQDSQKEN